MSEKIKNNHGKCRTIYDIDNNIHEQNQKKCDYELVLNNSYRVKLHRIVLTQIEFFRATQNFRENHQNVCNIIFEDIYNADFDSIVAFCYTNKIVLNKDNIRTIYKFSHYIGFESLNKVCCNFCKLNFNTLNIWKWNEFAEDSMILELSKAIKAYLEINFEKLSVDEHVFKNWSKEQVVTFISLDGLVVSSELKVLTFVFKWTKQFGVDRHKSEFESMLPHIRLQHVPSNSLKNFFEVSGPEYRSLWRNHRNYQAGNPRQEARFYGKGIYIIEETWMYPATFRLVNECN